MGFRTVVMLSNDMAHEWSKDPNLGAKILNDMHSIGSSFSGSLGQYGSVVECVHADTQTLARLDGYTSFKSLSYGARRRGPTSDEDTLGMVKRAAEDMGYRLVKISKK